MARKNKIIWQIQIPFNFQVVNRWIARALRGYASLKIYVLSWWRNIILVLADFTSSGSEFQRVWETTENYLLPISVLNLGTKWRSYWRSLSVLFEGGIECGKHMWLNELRLVGVSIWFNNMRIWLVYQCDLIRSVWLVYQPIDGETQRE